MRRIVETHEAQVDVGQIIDYLLDVAESDVARAIVVAIRDEYKRLATMPGWSDPTLQIPHLQNVRQWSVPSYPKYLILYQATDEDLIVCRVLHGARDIDREVDPDSQNAPLH